MEQHPSLWRKDIIGWSLYDFANTIFSMNIVSLYLKLYIIEDLGRDDRWFDIPYSISMIFAALLLPALGAVSDHSAKKKVFVILFTLTCCGALGLFPFIPPEAVLLLVVFFIVSNFSYEAGQPFYNALLYSVADGRQARFISGVGVALGYAGSVVGMLLVLPFVTGSLFGLEIPFISGSGKTGAFIPTAALFLLFSIPLFIWVHEKPIIRHDKINFLKAYRDVWDGIKSTKKYPGVLRFLVSDYFFEDAVVTVIINIGTYCSLVLGMEEGQRTLFLIISTVSAVGGSFLLGKIAQHWSLKRLLSIIVWGWIVCLIVFVFTDHPAVIWTLGSLIGILLGGLWTTSRPMLAELVPREDLGRFFGLFSLSGRSAAVVGPILWTIIVYLFRPERTLGKLTIELIGENSIEPAKLPYKVAVLSLVLLMALGLYIFRKVPDTHVRSHA